MSRFCVHVGFALALMAGAPFALAQKMYKCPDGAGGTVFQQAVCGETAKEAEARAKEKERLDAEAAKKKEEEAKRKADAIQKAKDRDKAYLEQEQQRAAERKKVEEAERKVTQGVTPRGAAYDGSMAPEMEAIYPAPWRQDAHAGITASFAKNKIACGQLKYRQRVGGGLGEFLVHCSRDGTNWVSYFVWPQNEAVKGPYKL